MPLQYPLAKTPDKFKILSGETYFVYAIIMKSKHLNAQPPCLFEGREDTCDAFLSRNGWLECKAQIIAEDWASRRYWRLTMGDKTRILLESLPDNHPQATPGHKIADTINIGKYLHEHGIHVAEIYDYDIENGYALLEDLGDLSFSRAINKGTREQELYETATQVLQTIQNSYTEIPLDLPHYKDSHVNKGKRRIIDWYVPLCRGSRVEEGAGDSFLHLFEKIEDALPACPQTFVHCDYHAENLMWLTQEKGIARVGVLDYQGALYGPAPYDLANLLEDIRRDVSEEGKAHCFDAFTQSMTAEEKEAFAIWYKLLALQFHCRLAGQVIKIFKIKQSDRYLKYLPRIQNFIRQEIKQPEFMDIRLFLQDKGCDLSADFEITQDRIKELVSEDAF